MKRKALVALAAALTIVATLTGVVLGASEVTEWQIGTSDGNVNPIYGAAEYPADRKFYETYTYQVGSDADPINSPQMPGYIGNTNVCDIDPNRACTDTTAELNINFSLGCNYEEGELMLYYDRYGSESDNLYLDGVLFDTISATESGFRQFSFDLGRVEAGDHTLTIEYAGGGTGNGHYIDYLKLVSDFQCVDIDIKPGSYPNSFNINGNGVIPVAILGSADFDVSEINIDTLSFGGLDVRVKGNGSPQCSIEDVSGANMPYGEPDGYNDLVCQFEDDADLWSEDNGTATVTGNLYDGTRFEGTDWINLVPAD